MNNDFSLFSQAGLERERDEALDLLAAKIPRLLQLSSEVNDLTHHVQRLRDQIAIRKANRVQWNGKPTKMEFVDA